jgi:hypothetical protein
VRNTKGFMVAKNEFSKKEWYTSMTSRMLNKGCVYDMYDDILKVDKADIWKERLMRCIRVSGAVQYTPLMLNFGQTRMD